MPEDAPVTTASGRWLVVAMTFTLSLRRRSEPRAVSAATLRAILRRAIGELHEVGGGVAGPHRREQARRPRRVHVPDDEPRRDPLRHAVRAHQQLPDGEPQAGPA